MGWILCFMKNLRYKHKQHRDLTASELTSCQQRLICIAQRESFAVEYYALDSSSPLPMDSRIVPFQPFLENGIIRLGSRLQFTALSHDEKHPTLLDGRHPFTELLIRHTHFKLHHLGLRIVLSELRAHFWILQARQAVKKALRSCLPCKLAHNPAGQELEAPLPADRVQRSTPFSVTGLHFAGPLYLRKNNAPQKAYVLLLTCASTRALHLELSSNMSVDKFLMAFQRFVSRRGLPHTVYSYNATAFHAAHRELQELCVLFQDTKTSLYFAHNGIHWKSIVPRVAWSGGWWNG